MDAVQDWLDRMVAEAEEYRRAAEERVADLVGGTVSGSDDLGLVRVTADRGGRVSDVELEPRAMDLSATDLAARVTDAVRAAQQAATEYASKLLAVAAGSTP